MLYAQLAALALAATALVASGCGGSSKSQSSSSSTIAAATTTTATAAPAPTTPSTTVAVATGKPLSRSQLIAQGDAICARTTTKLLPITIESKSQFERLIPQIAIYDKTEATELSKLVPPASMARDWTQIVNDIHLYGEDISRVAQDYQANNENAAGQLYHTAVDIVLEQRTAVAKRDGFKHCSLAR
jgi:hypothetical protein